MESFSRWLLVVPSFFSIALLAGCGADLTGDCTPVCGENQVCQEGSCACVFDTCGGLCCSAAQHCENSVCLPLPCPTKTECPEGLFCVDGTCVFGQACECNSECRPEGPEICDRSLGMCVPGSPPQTCIGDYECVAGNRCYSGRCMPSPPECLTNPDCTNPYHPRCLENRCVDECFSEADCGVERPVCKDGLCVKRGCTLESCERGTWCDFSDGGCKPGCDEDGDCDFGQVCRIADHSCTKVENCGGLCGASEYCDSLTATCVTECRDPAACPPGFTCEQASGRCRCTTGTCPVSSLCDAELGTCGLDPCKGKTDCPGTYTCDGGGTCIQPTPSPEGAFCLRDVDCDQKASLLCDNGLFCTSCFKSDPNFTPTFTCRKTCKPTIQDCPKSFTCRSRKPKGGLCVPKS